ncbi:Uricase [Phytophthora nicotianae]|uniref:Uricase n=1 Tax=Phytophthora nicotianae TaxID=4792 RepID=A0A0W8DF60_PHYNI|nr:Uricase [Phytophthora nicotianae]
MAKLALSMKVNPEVFYKRLRFSKAVGKLDDNPEFLAWLHALTSMQLADKVYDLVSTDLQQLVKRNAAEPAPVPNVLYSQ